MKEFFLNVIFRKGVGLVPLRLWESLDLELVPDLCSLLIGDIIHHEEAIRTAAAEALSSAVSQYRDQSASVLGQLTELYHQKLYVRFLLNRFLPLVEILKLEQNQIKCCFSVYRGLLLSSMLWEE